MLNCPKPETLLELISIPGELSGWKRAQLRFHLSRCAPCRRKSRTIEAKWQAYFTPEPEITSSLMRVYSQLQKDETLILKGWKIGRASALPSRRLWSRRPVASWLWRGGVSIGGAAALVWVVLSRPDLDPSRPTAAKTEVETPRVPLAQIRVEDKNSVKVHYVQPELLQTIEFETTSPR